MTETDVHRDLRSLVDRVCADYGDEYWRALDVEHSYPETFVDALTSTGLLGALVPEQYGGLGLGVGDGSVIVGELRLQAFGVTEPVAGIPSSRPRPSTRRRGEPTDQPR